MPYISTEALVGTALVAVLAIGYHLMPKGAEAGSSGGSGKKKNKKSKRKTTAAAAVKSGAAAGNSDEAPSAATTEVESDAPAKAKKGKGKAAAKASPAPAPKPAPAAVDTARDQPKPASFAAAAGGSSTPSAPAKPKLLAEKILPKPRKTKVDDMLEPEDRAPQLARVMKITSADKVPAFEEDYTESTSDDSADEAPAAQEATWNVVASKKKPVSLSIGGAPKVYKHSADTSDGLTKIQRKNAKKADAKKAQKAADEADRLRRLAQHKKTLERWVWGEAAELTTQRAYQRDLPDQQEGRADERQGALWRTEGDRGERRAGVGLGGGGGGRVIARSTQQHSTHTSCRMHCDRSVVVLVGAKRQVTARITSTLRRQFTSAPSTMTNKLPATALTAAQEGALRVHLDAELAHLERDARKQCVFPPFPLTPN
ncbi:hypothetical protein VHUM_04249 [Vanrija humicola]|uniref:Uncharacterized protein n=1 Tax=Vanrija humicola TaxID=5417 RepID=A0A7D8Z232_VANHU|nr:hypothetical protein VHUM_04249 [Vanrija humicola]